MCGFVPAYKLEEPKVGKDGRSYILLPRVETRGSSDCATEAAALAILPRLRSLREVALVLVPYTETDQGGEWYRDNPYADTYGWNYSRGGIKTSGCRAYERAALEAEAPLRTYVPWESISGKLTDRWLSAPHNLP